MLSKYYREYLAYFYNKYPESLNLSFQEHHQMIFDDHFSYQASLAKYMNSQGIKTEFVIANAEILQKQWALECNFSSFSKNNWEREILLAQIKQFKPDILWMMFLSDYFGLFVQSALQYCKKVILWLGSPIIKKIDTSGFSVLLTENPNTLKSVQNQFEKVIVTKPGFDSVILEKLGQVEKKHKLVFIGQVTRAHHRRVEILAYLVKNGIDIKIFGITGGMRSLYKMSVLRHSLSHIIKRRDISKGVRSFKNAFVKSDYEKNLSFIENSYQYPVFGIDYYRTLAESNISLNIHIDCSGEYSGNMRMFETTGVGSCLLTDDKVNNEELFQTGKEILIFDSKEHLLNLLKKYRFQFPAS